MTTPKGKILLAKLPKDIVQFCIEPYLMISKDEVRQNYENLMTEFRGHDPRNTTAYRGVWNPQTEIFDFVLIPRNYVAGDRRWRDAILGEVRRKRMKRDKIRELAAERRELCRIMTAVYIFVFLFIASMVFMGVYVSSR